MFRIQIQEMKEKKKEEKNIFYFFNCTENTMKYRHTFKVNFLLDPKLLKSELDPNLEYIIMDSQHCLKA